MKTKMTVAKTPLSFILCAVLIATMALLQGCSDETFESPTTPPQSQTDVSGEQGTTFTFEAYNKEGKATAFTITTTKATVGEALQEQGIIAGEEGPYGLYVKTVNGIPLDYDTDGMYWAFYENGNYAVNGVDKTPIDPAVTYSFKPAK